MDVDENTNVLDEVETLFKKLEGLPENLRQVAFSKIQEKLPVPEKVQVQFSANSSVEEYTKEDKEDVTTRVVGRKSTSVKDKGDISPVSSEPEIIVEDIYTSRGRKAKRISYVSLIRGSERKCEELSDPLHIDSASDPWISVTKRSRGRPKKRNVGGNIPGTSKRYKQRKHNPSEGAPRILCVKSLKSGEFEGYPNESEHDKNESKDSENDDRTPSDKPASKESLTDEEDSSLAEIPNKDSQKVGPNLLPALQLRKRRAQRPNYGCDDCSFQANTKALLEVHSRRHSGEKPFICPECGKGFPQSSGLNVHLKRHRGQRDYACDYCDYRAYTKVDKLRHMTIHTGERNQVCQYCGKAFAKDSTLREHVKSIHERSKKHVCEECGFSTYRANNLRVHIRMRHRGEYNNHVCPVCGARVKQRNAFVEHMRAHTGERPFKCDHCESSFACLARLTVHRKSVHEPRQFACDNCPKMFQTKHHLQRHAVTHTKDRPFSCPFCPYKCNTQGNMSKHVKIIHNKPSFSYRRFKAEQEIDSYNFQDPEWVEKGEKVMTEYLKELSGKLGQDITLEELRSRQMEKEKKLEEEAQQAKIKRLNRVQTREHSYHNNKQSPDEATVEEQKVDDPSSVILQVAAQEASSFVKIDMNASGEQKPQFVQLQEDIATDPKASEPQIIHIQTSGTDSSTIESTYQAVIVSDGTNVANQVFQFVSGETIHFCMKNQLMAEGSILADKAVEQQQALISYADEHQAEVVQTFSELNPSEEEGQVVVIIDTDSAFTA